VSNAYVYTYDQATTGMVPSYPCDYPCRTCLGGSYKSKCYSCFTSLSYVTEKYYYDNQCLTACPSGFYADSDLECQDCNNVCLTCSDSSTCDTCDSSGNYPYLYGQWCYSVCPDGTYASGNTCQACDSKCKTCSGSSTTCTSCDTSGTYKYKNGNSCVSSCDTG